MYRVNPRVDFVFKRLFGVQENVDLLRSLLNAILVLPEPIKFIDLLNPYNEKAFSDDKFSILDIKAHDETGRIYNIEMQVEEQKNYQKRSLYYWSKLYSEQLTRGVNFSKLTKTIGIHILNFDLFPREPDFHNVFRIKNGSGTQSYFDDFEFHTIELNKFDIAPAQLKSLLARWVTFLKSEGVLTEPKVRTALSSDPDIKKAIETLEHLNFSEHERDLYERRLKRLRDEDEVLETVRVKGIEEGLEKGMEKGKAEGKAEGIHEEKLATALKLIESGQTIKFASEITGLSVATIEAALVG